MEVSDLNILKEYKKDNRRGLELIYDRYRKYVYTIAFHYAGNKLELLPIKKSGGLDKLIDMVPGIMEKINEKKEEGKAEEKIEE